MVLQGGRNWILQHAYGSCSGFLVGKACKVCSHELAGLCNHHVDVDIVTYRQGPMWHEAMCHKPSINSSDGLGYKCNKCLGLLFWEVLSILWVAWCADCIECILEAFEITLGKAEIQGQHVLCGYGATVHEAFRGSINVLMHMHIRVQRSTWSRHGGGEWEEDGKDYGHAGEYRGRWVPCQWDEIELYKK